MPAPSDHAAHDPLLVAAHAAGDASGGDLARAAALLASCPDCARLHRDLRALPGALASAPAPARPRDFRLSPLQAESLRRPSGWRRLLAPLSGARSAAGPVAASLAALGVAGVLLGGGISLGAGGSATSALAPRAASSEAAASNGDATANFDTASSADPGAGVVSGAAGQQPSAAPSAAASAEAVVSAAASAAPSFGPAPMASSAASSAPSMAAPVATAAPLAPGPGDKNATQGGTTADATTTPPSTGEANFAPVRPSPTALPAEPAPAAPSGPSLLVIGSLVLLLAGVVLGILRIAARRLV